MFQKLRKIYVFSDFEVEKQNLVKKCIDINDLECIEYLIKYKKCEIKYSGLLFKAKSIEDVTFFLENGADPNEKYHKNNKNLTPLEYLTDKFGYSISKILVEYGANISDVNDNHLYLRLKSDYIDSNEIKELRQQIEELKFAPGMQGYRDAKEHWDSMI